MTTLLAVVTLAGAAVGVVLYLRWAERNSAALAQRDATLQAEQARRHATEQAEAEAAAKRKAAFLDEANKVSTSTDAARLLREAADRTGA